MTGIATYGYTTNSPLVGQVLFKQGSNTRMTTMKSYDKLNRLTGMISTPSDGGQLPFSFGASYNEANQRTSVTNNHLKLIYNPVWNFCISGESPYKLETPEI
ncbi:MAG: hypothetical protein PHQ11_10365 [Paludibacter sp.]|nr:hypothetical protein [Paludibacter sp.]